jgi:hypothetical protein
MSRKQCRSSLRLIIFSTFFPMYSDNLRKSVFVSSSVKGLMIQGEYYRILCFSGGAAASNVAIALIKRMRWDGGMLSIEQIVPSVLFLWFVFHLFLVFAWWTVCHVCTSIKIRMRKRDSLKCKMLFFLDFLLWFLSDFTSIKQQNDHALEQ